MPILTPTRRQVPRDNRRPLYVHVVTQPPLTEAWTVNISPGGLGIIADRDESSHRVVAGSRLHVEFRLPSTGAELRAEVTVAWRQDATVSGSVAFGLVLTDAAPTARAEIARYLSSEGLQVAVFGASAEQRARITEGLAQNATPYFATREALLEETLARGHVSCVLVCAEDARTGWSRLERVFELVKGPAPDAAPPREWTPHVVYAGPADAAQLVRAFNARALIHALPAHASPSAFRDVVLEAGRDLEVRREQRRLALDHERAARRQRAAARAPLQLETEARRHMVVHSAVMREVLETLRTVAPHRVAVLLQGETGTGKEVLAQALHALSDRAEAPFVVQDCGTLTETLLESELFGHVRGAFTGAVSDHPGLFLMAEGGTVFLDEVENTTPKLQAALLRVLETGQVRPVGGRNPRTVDVRVVCASNRSLAREVERGTFRADLYYRLAAFPVVVPPLRERTDDVVPLARFFLARLGAEMTLSPEAERLLGAYPWPGNVRELRNVVERAVIMARGRPTLQAADFPAHVREGAVAARGGELRGRLQDNERELIAQALERHGGVVVRAADELGMNRITLARRMRRLGLGRRTAR